MASVATRPVRIGVLAVVLLGFLAVTSRSALPAADADTVVHLTAAADVASTPEAGATLTRIAQAAPDAHLVPGDLSYSTAPETQWCDFVKARVGEGFPFEIVAGNHESNGQHGDINDFAACLPNQIPGVRGIYGREYFYDLPRSNPLVRVINASAGQVFPEGQWNYAVGDAHYNWTANAIDSARAAGIPWVVVATHYPCLSMSDYSCAMPTSFFQLLQSKKVDLVLVGHDHAYMRTHQLRSGVAGCTTIAADTADHDCIGDTDDVYAAGAGTVFATVGTGGVGLRDVNSTDTEAPYFAAAMGSNANPTWGVLDVQLSATELNASFLRSAGGTFTDSFRIARQGATNTPPNASFSTTVSGRSVTADASASADPDGTIVEYQWDFGDGTQAGGETPPAHTYASDGTYTITLTVTDDAGGTATTTRTVTVTAPTGGAPTEPTGVTARALTQTRVEISWHAVAGATGYRVFRDGAQVGTSGSPTFTDSGLSPATQYSYTVQAVNDAGTSQMSQAATVTTKTYLVHGDTWRVNDTGTNLGTAWRAPTYDDSSWRTGPSQLGYGENDEGTVLRWGSDPTRKYPTSYARTTFDAGGDISAVTGIALRGLVDDGAIVYLNGTEVWRYNMPAGTVSYTTLSATTIMGSAETTWRTATLPKTALRTGENVVAVEIHQDARSSSDVSFDLELRPTP